MAWIESHQSLSKHRKTLRAAGLLQVNRHLLIGHLHELWWWALDNVPADGHLGDLTDEEIAAGAEWPGDPKEFVRALTDAGFIDETDNGRYLHDWYDYAGKILEKRAHDAERKRAERRKASTGRPKDVRRTSSGRPADVRKPSGDCPEDVHGAHVAQAGRNEAAGTEGGQQASGQDDNTPQNMETEPQTAFKNGLSSGCPPDVRWTSNGRPADVHAYRTVPNLTVPREEAVVVVDSAPANESEQAHGDSARQQSLDLMRRHLPTWFTSGRYYETLLGDADALGWDLILAAVQRTLAAGKTDIRYCLGITKRWIEAGIQSVEDLEIHEARAQAEREQRARPKGRTTAGPREVHPIDEFDWSEFN